MPWKSMTDANVIMTTNFFRHTELRKSFTGSKKAFQVAKPRRHVLLLIFVPFMLTSLYGGWVRNDRHWDWLSAFRIAESRWRQTDVQAWVHYSTTSNETRELLDQLSDHAVSPCREEETRAIRVLGLPTAEPGNPIRLACGSVHKILIVSVNERGDQICEGGDYYETDLSGERWKSRPPVRDVLNGTYEIQLQVDQRFAGLYLFKIILLYSRFHGLEQPPRFYRAEEVAMLEILFEHPQKLADDKALPQPSLCKDEDYDLSRWSGRWTRSQKNETCVMDSKGRYQCLPHGTECDLPWCEGLLDRVDSNGWIYSAHCRFKLFTPDEAWDCLDKKWLMSWGDSTSQHTWQNLLAFVMEYDEVSVVDVPRRMDRGWVRPVSATGASEDARQSFRLTMVYNGHANEEGEFQGLESLNIPEFRELLSAFFVNASSSGNSPPDVIVMNSGLHDAFYYRDPQHFVSGGLSMATAFWKDILDAIQPNAPQIIYRTSVATAGAARAKEYNPQKIEHYNRLFVDSLQKLNLSNFRIVDGFDLTFPWHYDNHYSDGTHYGLKPNYGARGHQYFVDHMFAHILLNAICLQ